MSSQFGPAGGPGGVLLRDDPHGNITRVLVRHGDYVDVIVTTFSDGSVLVHGGADGDNPPNQDEIVLNAGEYLTAIDGRITSNSGDGGPYIKNIRFTTTVRQTPYWGGSVSDPNIPYYSFGPAFGYQIVGFVGCSGKYVDDIGVLLDPIPGAAIGATGPIPYGPSGGIGGAPFSGRTAQPPTTIKQIQIKHGWNVDSIEIIWNDGFTEKYGGDGGDGLDTFVLDDDEWLVGISGGRRDPSDGDFVKFLQFTTNKRTSPTFGPAGGFSGHPFAYQAPAGMRIYGILGRCGSYLDAIGVYMA